MLSALSPWMLSGLMLKMTTVLKSIALFHIVDGLKEQVRD